MKKTEIINWIMLLLVFCSACKATAQSETSTMTEIQEQGTSASAPRGAASADELAEKLFVSIQAANVGAMDQYFLSEGEISTIQEKGSPEMRAVFRNLTAEQISGRFKEDYNQMIARSVSRNINWAEVNLAEAIPRKETNKGQPLFPVEMVLRDRANQEIKVVFEAIYLNGRYFLFRQIAFA